MNNSVYGKTMENVRNHKDIKLVKSDTRRKPLVSEPNCHSHKKFSEHLMAIEMKKTKIKMIKPIYLGMSVLDISKTLMYEFWYDYIKPKYGDKAKLCYADTDSFVIYIKIEDRFVDIAGDVKRWFDTSNFDKNDKGPPPIGENKKVPGVFKDELGGKIMKEFVALRAKTYAYLIHGYEKNKIINKKAEGTKKCVIKRELMFENYKDCMFNGKVILKSQQRFKSNHKEHTEEVNKIALSSNDDTRLQTFDGIETYPYGTTNEIIKVFESKETLKMWKTKMWKEI